jgi:hypothetical protein
MRRCVLVFFMCLLPFQMVWATAAPYCDHESERCSVEHFGHHEHQHRPGAAEDAASAGLPHADCASCHLGCAVTLPSPVVAIPAVAAHILLPAPSAACRSHLPAGPERPDRA